MARYIAVYTVYTKPQKPNCVWIKVWCYHKLHYGKNVAVFTTSKVLALSGATYIGLKEKHLGCRNLSAFIEGFEEPPGLQT